MGRSSIDDIVLTGSSEGRGDCCSSSSEDGNKSGTTLERDANCHSHTYNQGSETSQQFTCSVENCPKTFTRKKDLVHHVQNGHSKDTKRGLRFRCPIKECPVTLARERDVRRHMYFKHSIGKGHDRRFLCSAKDCHATFSRRYDLKRHDDAVHKNNTEGGRQFSCPVEKCNTVVSRAIDLHDHISTQHNQDTINSDRPFMCPICLEERRKHEGFTRWRDVLRHLTSAIHSSRNFTCPHCDKSFSRNDILSRHMRCCKKRPGNWTENDEEHESSDECN
ncbi:hypothetical protein BDA99DRAFT_243167 [Phascolomyces articulosus]|uniref:C2H2-type domain-containing protein n=1 Tax=Phascolomyces articulosus TaxID=60185 RepID=A0AAD5K901_9FUNG|nr:hypothetical protein BDA99DRAFT_243167 [Phascolomyces articulosus]